MSNSPRNSTLAGYLAKYGTPEARAQAAAHAVPSGPVGDAARIAHEAAQESRLSDHLAQCGVPTDVRERVLAGLCSEPYPATPATREWTRSDAVFLLLLGAAGSGKSTAAGQVLQCARKQGTFMDDDGRLFQSWVYSSAAGLWVDAFEMAHTSVWNDPDGIWEKAMGVQWLVVDDVMTEKATDTWIEHFQALVSKRHKENLRTVITANATWHTFGQKFGQRVADRIREKGVVFNAGDVSKRKTYGSGS